MAEQIPRNDLAAIALGRLLEQYKDSTKLRALIDLFVSEATEAQDAIWSLLDGVDLDVATGWALDVIGRQVGLPRPTIDATLFGFFGYAGAPNAQSYGDDTLPEVGGRYLSSTSSTTGNVLMEDEDFRAHIRAKIVRNQCSATAENTLEIIRLVIPNSGVSTVDATATAHASIVVGRALSSIEKAFFLIDDLNGNGDRLIPRPMGVSLDYADTAGPF
jgi:hypothetical protein